jgi:hypothetical protein
MDASYENYTLLQLISIMEGSKYSRKCPWNKQAIIEFIEKENLNIPKKIKEMEPTKWHHYSTQDMRVCWLHQLVSSMMGVQYSYKMVQCGT